MLSSEKKSKNALKKWSFGLTLGKLIELGRLAADLHETLPDKITQDEPSIDQRSLNSVKLGQSDLENKQFAPAPCAFFRCF